MLESMVWSVERWTASSTGTHHQRLRAARTHCFHFIPSRLPDSFFPRVYLLEAAFDAWRSTQSTPTKTLRDHLLSTDRSHTHPLFVCIINWVNCPRHVATSCSSWSFLRNRSPDLSATAPWPRPSPLPYSLLSVRPSSRQGATDRASLLVRGGRSLTSRNLISSTSSLQVATSWSIWGLPASSRRQHLDLDVETFSHTHTLANRG